jgi:hypothetical protein
LNQIIRFTGVKAAVGLLKRPAWLPLRWLRQIYFSSRFPPFRETRASRLSWTRRMI